MITTFIARRLRQRHIWERIFRERLSEPLHLNLLSIPVALVGSTRAKIYFDLLIRQHHAYGLLRAADTARELGVSSVTAIEFGVANGAGLLNICDIAGRIERETGVTFRVVGFDTGAGMPPPADYRDHPEHYQAGDFPMEQPDRLKAMLPGYASLVLGPLAETLPDFVRSLNPHAPIGFVSLDVDYYTSSKEALSIFDGPPEAYLPYLPLYLDDVMFDSHNPWCGELLAIREFNEAHDHRKIAPATFLRNKRLFKNADWIDHMFTVHVLDHSYRSERCSSPRVLDNPYIKAAL